MKNLLKTLTTICAVTLLIWAVGYTAPKIIDIYKGKQIEKPDTVYYHDTIYFEKTVTDSFPDYHYITEVRRDTFYKFKGDSVERIPRVITLKKKLPVKRYYLEKIR